MKKNILNNLQNTILIVGIEEIFTNNIIDELLILFMNNNILRFYFVSPPENIIDYLENKGLVYKTDFIIINSINDIDNIEKSNVIICGFKPVDKALKLKFQNFKNEILYFGELGIFRNTWNKNIKSSKIIETSLTEYIDKYIIQYPEIEKVLIPDNNFNFVNRGKETELYENFIDNIDKRACKIIGLEGIGKQSFIQNLNKTTDLGENWLPPIRFIEKKYNLSYIIKHLVQALKIKVSDKEIPIHYPNHTPIIVKKIFKEFDKIENSKIFFLDFNLIINDSGKIIDPNLEMFIEDLISRDTYQGNRIYFISTKNFSISTKINKYFDNIYLNLLRANHIQQIMKYDFYQKGQRENAKIIRKLDYEDIEKVIGGHPTVAKLFVSATEKKNITQLIKDKKLRIQFEKKKIEYLLKVINVSNKEKKLLNLLILIKKPFTDDFFRLIKDTTSNTLQSLINKFLINFNSGKKEYNVPALIKETIKYDIKNTIVIKNNDEIGQIYWDLAENSLSINSTKTFDNYRSSLYHFERAENQIKIDLLVSRFKYKFLEKAEDFYKENKLQKAWYYFDILYKIDYLPNKKYWNFFLKSGVNTDQKEIDKLFIEALDLFPKDEFIKTTYASYLFHHKKMIEKSEEICLEIMDENPDNYGINNFYNQILFAKGEKKQAIDNLSSWIKRFSEIRNPTKNDTKQLESFKKTLDNIRNTKNNQLEKGNFEYFKNLTQNIIDILVKMSKRDDGKKSENIHNDYLSDFLQERKYNTDNQARTGNKLIDIEIQKENGATISIIEGLKLSGLDRNYIYDHIFKLLNEYDKTGNFVNYIVVYSECDDYSNLWKKYLNFLNEMNDFKTGLNYKIQMVKDRNNETGKADIFFAETIHNRNNEEISIYHLFVNMKK